MHAFVFSFNHVSPKNGFLCSSRAPLSSCRPCVSLCTNPIELLSIGFHLQEIARGRQDLEPNTRQRSPYNHCTLCIYVGAHREGITSFVCDAVSHRATDSHVAIILFVQVQSRYERLVTGLKYAGCQQRGTSVGDLGLVRLGRRCVAGQFEQREVEGVCEAHSRFVCYLASGPTSAS